MEYTYFDLHSHSLRSREGREKQERGFSHIPPAYSPSSLLKRAFDVGLDFMAVTDHNMMPICENPRIIPGIELTCKPSSNLERFVGEAHIIIINPKQDFFDPNNFPDIYGVIENARADGSQLILPHPLSFERTKKKYYKMLSGVETYYSYTNPFVPVLRKNAIRISNLGPARVAGSDAHTLGMIGLAQNKTRYCETVDEILCELENRQIISATSTPKLLNTLRTLIAN